MWSWLAVHDLILFLFLLQVHEEFKQNVENIGVENLIQKFTEQKGTGKERPGETQKLLYGPVSQI